MDILKREKQYSKSVTKLHTLLSKMCDPVYTITLWKLLNSEFHTDEELKQARFQSDF